MSVVHQIKPNGRREESVVWRSVALAVLAALVALASELATTGLEAVGRAALAAAAGAAVIALTSIITAAVLRRGRGPVPTGRLARSPELDELDRRIADLQAELSDVLLADRRRDGVG